MSKIGKYMVYNPQKDKPKAYYNDRNKALDDAIKIRDKEKTDIYVMEIVNVALYEQVNTDIQF